MKKLLFTALLAMITAGCTTFIVDDIVMLAKLSGAATGQALTMAKLEPKVHNTVIEVTQFVSNITPGTNETFTAVWTKEAGVFVDKAIADGKLDAAAKPLVMAGVTTLCLGIDYMFEKHPDWKSCEDKVAMGTKGFCEGLLSVMKPVNTDAVKLAAPVTKCVSLDADTLMYLKSKGCF